MSINLKKFEDMPDKDWADILMIWFKDNPKAIMQPDAADLYHWAMKNCSDWQFKERDRSLEMTKHDLEKYDSFRQKCIDILHSERMDLSDWMHDLNALYVDMNYTRDIEKKKRAIKNFEDFIARHYKKFHENPKSLRFYV